MAERDKKIAKFLTQRAVLCEQLTRMKMFVETSGQTASLPELELRLKLSENYFEHFESVQSNLEVLDPEEPTKSDRGDFETLYFLVKPALQVLINQHESLASKEIHHADNSMMVQSSVKLPTIDIEPFDGCYTKWIDFYETFQTLVHNNQSLNNITRFHFLRRALRDGPAYGIIESLELTDSNYSEAMKLVRARYNNKKIICSEHIKKIFAIEPISKPSATRLREMINIVRSQLRSLASLNRPTVQWDDLIVHLLCSKLDGTTLAKWDEVAPIDRLATLDELFSALERQCQHMESRSVAELQRRVVPPPTKIHKNVFQAMSRVFQCTNCDSKSHMIYKCDQFSRLSIPDRKKVVTLRRLCDNCLKRGHRSTACFSKMSCKFCRQKHHSLFHSEISDHLLPVSEPQQPSASGEVNTKTVAHAVQTIDPGSVGDFYVVLATAIVKLIDRDGNPILCRALLDSGSQINLITQSMATKLGLSYRNSRTLISGVGSSSSICRATMVVQLQSRFNEFSCVLETHVMPSITGSQPSVKFHDRTSQMPNDIELADPRFNHPQRIDLLIGAEWYLELLRDGRVRLSNESLMLQNTVLGWIISGKTPLNCHNERLHNASCHMVTQNSDDLNLNETLKRFWKISEESCENFFKETVSRSSDGRFVVRLPFQTSPSTLGDSKTVAVRRFLNLERRLQRDPILYEQYSNFIHEFETLGHMKREDDVRPNHYYLPHHCVQKDINSKLCVVFDASCKTDSGKSLNDILMVGPVVEQELFSIILRFRTHKFVFTCDIVKMYRQIEMDENDSHYQYILWRNNPNESLQTYRLTTVTYGTASAPYLATKCLQTLAICEQHRQPLASKILQRDAYVDDILSGCSTFEGLLKTRNQLIKLLKTAGMELRKWCSNDKQLLNDIPMEYRQEVVRIDDNNLVKTLGMYWQPDSDFFCFYVEQATTDSKLTKRKILSEIARLYDPIGLLGPVTTRAKVFMQQLWRLKQDWDEALPQELSQRWINFRKELLTVNNIRIQRHILTSACAVHIEIHGYSDASEIAYGAAVYIRCIGEDGTVSANLLCSKSRVAPLKKITITRLELCAALLLSQLVQRLLPILDIKINRVSYWTDSKTVLSWINGHPSNWKTFVANRVVEIQQISHPSEWKYINTKLNPADAISRGLSPQELEHNTLWFHGPAMLSHTTEPSLNQETTEELPPDVPEKRSTKFVLNTIARPMCNLIDGIKYRNNLFSLQKILAYVCRFVCNLRTPKEKRSFGILSSEELHNGLMAGVIIIQRCEFPLEYTALQNKRDLPKKSKLVSLCPFMDDKKLLRVGGRLKHATLPADAKNPVLLPAKHPFTNLIISCYHRKMLHAGPQGTLASVRENFWPINGKRAVAKVINNCIKCFRCKPKGVNQLMGDLPSVRVCTAHPFENVGVDFCGPFMTHYKVRGKKPAKSYVAVFVCYAIKAVHLELVTELSTDAFIGALKRFVATRGLCRNIYSDNATNFVGANNELQELYHLFQSQKHQNELTSVCQKDGINWHFAPPVSPHFGGMYEAAVKSCKHHLRRIMGNASLTFEELNTLIKQIEAALNSRPLIPLSSDVNDLQAITPGHFLIGRPLNAILEPNLETIKTSTLKRWQLIQELHRHFWDRWSREYLQELQHRRKWQTNSENVSVGALVIIKDDNLPPLKWKLARILEVHYGDDRKVRVVTLKTSSGTLKRAITRICPLPTDSTLKAQGFQEGEDV